MKKILHLGLILFFASTTLLLVNCKDDDTDDNNTTPKTKKELLIGKTWYAVLPNTQPQECKFNSDGTMSFVTPTVSGTYVWDANDSMKLSVGGSNITWWFKTVNDTMMEYWPTFEPSTNIYQFKTHK